MLSVKGVFQNGVAQPAEPIEGRDGQMVVITFLDEGKNLTTPSGDDASWDALAQLVEQCKVETGISDLAHQHDYYLYGKPKKE
jgi:hypothetical protein